MKLLQLIALLPLLITMTTMQLALATTQEDGLPGNTWNIKANQQVQLVADVTNNQDVKQLFVYIIQVTDNDGKSVMVTWIQGTLQPHQSMSPSQSWTPTKPGTYTAQIFDWPCLDNCGALSFPLEMKIIVT